MKLRVLAMWMVILGWSATVLGQTLLRGDSKPGSPDASEAERLAAATLVVFNESDPESRELAFFYALKRGIPKDQVIGLPCATAEQISREEYDTRIAEPLRRLFTTNFWWTQRDPESPLGPVATNKIRFVALMRGIPLKIAGTTGYPGDKATGPEPIASRNEAAVDSELAVLGFPTRTISGAFNNPYFRSYLPIVDADRPELLLVCRLDGPSAAIVRKMIVDSLEAEKTGLNGFTYVDARGLNADSGGLLEGDKWMLAVAKKARERGAPVILDNGPGMFPDAYPLRHAANYFGWYSEHVAGPFAEPGFQFAPGAIACHIHSFSADTVRDRTKNWVGPLLNAGAAATLGNVYEPYLALTPQLDIFHERLQGGFTFAESAYMAQRALSWMTTFVGDPLYRPYPARAKIGNSEWDAYRSGAQAWFKGGRKTGQAALAQSGKRLRSGVVYEGLGLLELTADEKTDALAAFQQARKFYKRPDDIIRVAIHEVILLMSAKRTSDAHALARAQIAAHPGSRATEVLKMFLPPPSPPPAKP